MQPGPTSITFFSYRHVQQNTCDPVMCYGRNGLRGIYLQRLAFVYSREVSVNAFDMATASA
eukprot:6136812-Ditylum_brightwellii.AAC.1